MSSTNGQHTDLGEDRFEKAVVKGLVCIAGEELKKNGSSVDTNQHVQARILRDPTQTAHEEPVQSRKDLKAKNVNAVVEGLVAVAGTELNKNGSSVETGRHFQKRLPQDLAQTTHVEAEQRWWYLIMGLVFGSVTFVVLAFIASLRAEDGGKHAAYVRLMEHLAWMTTCLFLVFWAGGLFSKSGLHGEFLGMRTWQTKAVFVGYVALFIAVTFTTKGIASIGIQPAVLVMASNIAKSVASLAIWLVQDGSLGDLLATTLREGGLVLRYSGLACLFVVCDVLRVDFIQRTSPSSFHILMNFRAVLLVVVWERVMNRRLGLPQWLSVLAIAMGCTLKEWRHLSEMELGGQMRTYVELFMLMFISAGAIVYNEYLLKGTKMASVNFQNMALYVNGCITLVGVSLLCVYFPSVHVPSVIGGASVLDPQQWWLLLTRPAALAQVTLLTLLGLVTAHFLRLLSSVTKEVATGVEVICSVPLDTYIYGVAFGFNEISGSMLVVLGICIIARWPLPEAKASGDEVDETTKLCYAEQGSIKPKTYLR